MIIIDYRWLSLTFIDYRWLLLIIIDYRWLSLIIVDYHWLSLIINDYNWFTEYLKKKKNIWRGVRSGVQLSCTETRFQKCCQSGKNGSKHLMFSISLACNMISCKKSNETLIKSKLPILQWKFCSRAQKSPKIPTKKTLCSIAICSKIL